MTHLKVHREKAQAGRGRVPALTAAHVHACWCCRQRCWQAVVPGIHLTCTASRHCLILPARSQPASKARCTFLAKLRISPSPAKGREAWLTMNEIRVQGLLLDRYNTDFLGLLHKLNRTVCSKSFLT